jgi:hypothetical protein
MPATSLRHHRCLRRADDAIRSGSGAYRRIEHAAASQQATSQTCEVCNRTFLSTHFEKHQCKFGGRTLSRAQRALVAEKLKTLPKSALSDDKSTRTDVCDLCGRRTSNLKEHWAQYCRMIVQGGAPGLGRRR